MESTELLVYCTRPGLYRLLAVLAVALSAACGDGSTDPPPPPPNRAPVASGAIPAQVLTVGQSAPVNVAAYFSDPDGDQLSYAAATSAPNVAGVAVAGSTVTITGAGPGTATVTVTARDPGGLTATQNAGVTVEQPNRAPAAVVSTAPPQTSNVGDTLALDVAPFFSDPDGDPLAFTAESSDTGVVAVSVAGSTLTGVALAAGVATVTVSATDPEGLTAALTAEVTVVQPNRAPVAVVAAAPPQGGEVGDTIILDVAPFFADPDGDSLAFAAESSDAGVVTASLAGGTLAVALVGAGTATVTVTATDPEGLSASLAAEVAVEQPNRAPVALVAAAPPQRGEVGDTLSLEVAPFFSDPDGDPLAFAAESSDAGVVTVSVEGGGLTAAFVGAGIATVTVTATDPEGLAASLTAAVTVVHPNRPPVVTEVIPPQNVTAGGALRVDASALFSDPDGDPLAYLAETSDTTVLAALVAGDTVTVAALAAGAATVTISATDPEGLSASLTVSVTVTAGAARSVFRADFDSDDLSGWELSASAAEVADGILRLTSTDSEAEGQALHRLRPLVRNWTARARLGREDPDNVWYAITVFTGDSRWGIWSLHFGSGVPRAQQDTNFRLFIADVEAGRWVPMPTQGWGYSNALREGAGEFTDITLSLQGRVLRALAGETELFSIAFTSDPPAWAESVAVWALAREAGGQPTVLVDWVEVTGDTAGSAGAGGEEVWLSPSDMAAPGTFDSLPLIPFPPEPEK